MADNIKNEGFLARFGQRDSDTLLTWGNTGLMMFMIFHEWGDSFDPATGKTGTIDGETYNADTDSFEPNCTEGTPVFNGRLSGLWDCVSQAWPEDLAAMYRAMRSAGFNADSMWKLYQKFRTQWCEALYNADAMGYANTGRFDMAYGDKSEAVRHILKARFRYLDSKYGANTSTPLEMRLWGNGAGLMLKYYCPIYASMNWGAGGIITRRAVTPGEPSYFQNPGVTFNETTVTVYNADLITEIGTYKELPDGSRVEGGLQDLATRSSVTGLSVCRRLKKLEFDFSDREANTNLDGRVLEVCRSVALRRITVRNCPNVTGHADFASQVIEEIDFRGTGVTGATVPETDTLRSLRFGASVNEIRISHLGGLATLTAEGVSNLGVISVHDCPLVDIRPLLHEALASGSLHEVSVTGVDWSGYSAADLEKLADIGADITGTIALADNQNMSFELKRKCLAAWGDIDSESNPLYISYIHRPVDIIRISGAGYYGEPGDYQLRVIPEDPNANDFTAISWSISTNSYAEIDTLTGRVRVSSVGAEADAPTATVTVKVIKPDGSDVAKTASVGFYHRSAHYGDFVYADGSYSPNTEYDPSKTVIGLCCYIDPDFPDTRRLAVGVRPIGGFPYGYAASDPEITLASSAGSVTDILDIPDFKASAWSYVASCGNSAIRDTSDAGDAFGFKRYGAGSLFASVGFTVTDKDLGTFTAGSELPVGMIETMAIILHRNSILRDGNVNLAIPAATDSTTEFQNLQGCMASASSVSKSLKYLYFPAASAAYAYEPTVLKGEALADKFKAHHWFLPAPGDGLRLGWLTLQTGVEGSDFDIWSKPLGLNLATIKPNYIPTTGEFNLKNSYIVINANPDVAGIQLGASAPEEHSGRHCVYNIYPMVAF